MNVEKLKDKSYPSIISIIATVIPILLWAGTLIFMVAGRSFSDADGSGVWGIIIAEYYFSLGIPLFIASVVFGFLGLKTKLRRLALVSLCLKLATLWVLTIVVIIEFAKHNGLPWQS